MQNVKLGETGQPIKLVDREALVRLFES